MAKETLPTRPKTNSMTITRLTGGLIKAAPTKDELITQIRQELSSHITQAEEEQKQQQAAGQLRGSFNKAVRRAQKELARFEQIISHVPDGFALAPVYYKGPDTAEKKDIYDEYLTHVRSQFLRYIATEHADAVTALGICETGIDRMRKGLEPAADQKRPYNVDIDHIVERAGSWHMGDTQQKDPLNPGRTKAQVNHFANLILLPSEIHGMKNNLNNVQFSSGPPARQGRWMLMLVPDDTHAGFVCPPQPKRILNGLSFRTSDISRKTGYLTFQIDNVYRSLESLRQSSIVRKALALYDAIAENKNTTVMKAAAQDPELSRVFNYLATQDPHASAELAQIFRPGLNEIKDSITDIFNEVSPDNPSAATAKQRIVFSRLYQGRKIKRLKKTLTTLPFPEAQALSETLTRIDNKLKEKPPQV